MRAQGGGGGADNSDLDGISKFEIYTEAKSLVLSNKEASRQRIRTDKEPQMSKGLEGKTAATRLGGAAISKSPTWTTLPQQPCSYIHADHRIETDIDALGVGRVRVKPGYDCNLEEIRYGY